jgi:hypothetical protein
MKRNFLIAMMFLAASSFAAAQIGAAPTTDVLGAHLNYGRGCAACHAPHSGAYGNGNAKTTDTSSGNNALWGEDVASLYGKMITSGGTSFGNYVETLPTSMSATTPDVFGMITCLSCHDGNYATGAMMKNEVYEALPSTYGTLNKIPTLLGDDTAPGTTGTGTGNYLNDHPVGDTAIIPCNTPTAPYWWDCTISGTGKIQPGPNMTTFINNYGFFVSPGVVAGQPVVVCTTCHNQHLMNVVSVTNKPFVYNSTTPTAVSGTQTGLPTGIYSTMFFIRAPYNPFDTASNQTAQFCRQCHGGESNEMNGGTAGTIF